MPRTAAASRTNWAMIQSKKLLILPPTNARMCSRGVRAVGQDIFRFADRCCLENAAEFVLRRRTWSSISFGCQPGSPGSPSEILSIEGEQILNTYLLVEFLAARWSSPHSTELFQNRGAIGASIQEHIGNHAAFTRRIFRPKGSTTISRVLLSSVRL